jgi:hypothetical protein
MRVSVDAYGRVEFRVLKLGGVSEWSHMTIANTNTLPFRGCIRWIASDIVNQGKCSSLWIFNVKLSMLGGIAGEAEEPGDEEYFNLTKVTTET